MPQSHVRELKFEPTNTPRSMPVVSYSVKVYDHNSELILIYNDVMARNQHEAEMMVMTYMIFRASAKARG
jgi:hypothetical protein